ncbi:type I-E CRISPR-associated protein Cse1/CasA [Geobacter sp. 60473]|uniref:type I-E CRISPR-associated protein Cse1/CasA n=1 Tax=Geobacter sp. 60473 TaxID=3080755 RepID=UPI002B2C2C9A|nr:type I-E CRISPR-associated protein Cse1/CasA [Geobacter sp. 60473]
MNLLTEAWIPVRPLPAGAACKLTLRQLLCEDGRWELCLPRDDMELAALQLLICMTQVFFPPQSTAALKQRIVAPLSLDEFESGCAPYREWFRLDHPDFPFMQVRNVSAKDPTPMDKLLAGLTGATNSCFVNEPGLGACLCGGCAAIALFNQSSNAPSFGGGFKGSLRGGAPVTTLVQGEHLRQTVWLNVLSEERLTQIIPWHHATRSQQPTWVAPIKAGETIPSQTIGMLRGLFWQPGHLELMPPQGEQTCICCGFVEKQVYTGFNKAKFNYTIDGLWPHPHGPRISSVKKGEREEKFVSFTTAAPAWTQLSRFVVQRQMTNSKEEGQEPAAVVRQAQGLLNKLRLTVGGYRNNQASILERRHELIFLNDGWSGHTEVVHALVGQAVGYRDALNKSLFVFSSGFKEIKGAGVKVHELAKEQFYRRSEDTVLDTLARIDFEQAAQALLAMGDKLHSIVVELFNESVAPYRNDPELIRTTAVARKTLYKHLNALKPQRDGRRDDGTNA